MAKPRLAEKDIVREATFRFEVTDYDAIRKKGKGVISPPHIIGGLPWRIVALADVHYLGLFIQCDGDPEDPFWSCEAFAELRLLPGSSPTGLFSRKIKQIFYTGQAWAGFADFPPSLYEYVKGDSIIVETWISTGEPRHLSPFDCASFSRNL